MRQYLYISCYTSKYEKGMYDEFQDVFYAVRYENTLTKSEKGIW